MMLSIDYEKGYQYAVREYGRYDNRQIEEIISVLSDSVHDHARGMVDGCREIIRQRLEARTLPYKEKRIITVSTPV